MSGPDPASVVRLPLVGSDAVGQVTATLARVNEAFAAAVHRGDERRPYSTPRRGEALDVILFDDRLAYALLLADPVHALVARQTAGALLAAGDGGNRLALSFVSPCHFRAGRPPEQGNRGDRRDYLFPCPERVFADLLAAWVALGWPAVEPPNLNRVGGGLDAYAVRDHPCSQGRRRRGFVGRAVYDLAACSARDRAALWALARFGMYRGVGAHTAYGMGRIEVG